MPARGGSVIITSGLPCAEIKSCCKNLDKKERDSESDKNKGQQSPEANQKDDKTPTWGIIIITGGIITAILAVVIRHLIKKKTLKNR